MAFCSQQRPLRGGARSEKPLFVRQVRGNLFLREGKTGLSRKEITLKAISDCKDAGLLREFWEKMSQEEIDMLTNERNMETVSLNALAEGLPMGMIQKITGFDTEAITSLSQKALLCLRPNTALFAAP